MPKILVFLLLILPLGCLAQFTISGRVLNQVDGKPVANTSVFLSNATIGSKTAENGTFTLSNVKPGKYLLVVSNVAFEGYNKSIIVSSDNIKLDDIAIFPKTIGLKAVTIRPDPNRNLYLSMFREQFFGKGDIADQCKILNPEILDLAFDDKTNILTASSSDFLEIENPALGYDIKYKLDDFEWVNDSKSPEIRIKGTFVFEPQRGAHSEERRWERTRLEIYKNSSMHFFRAVLDGKVSEEGFKVQQLAYYANPNRPTDSVINLHILRNEKLLAAAQSPRDPNYLNGKKFSDSIKYWQRELKISKNLTSLWPYALQPQEILHTTNQPGIFAVGCDFDGLFVTYNEDKHFDKNIKASHIFNPRNTDVTLISFNAPYAIIDANGIVINPYDIYYTGVWTGKRMGELLPVDYEPPKIIEPPADSTIEKRVTAQLQKYSDGHITEKAYLHFDKPYYAAGDTMYFKAYLTAGEQHELSALSSVLHVDLISADNKIKQSLNLEVVNGVAWGDFTLPDSSKGNYRVRAYTNVMRNAGDKAFFDQVISVGAPAPNKIPESGVASVPSAKAKPDIRFFPEGGELVSGIKSKIAFKAINTNGLGVDVKGVIVDEGNKDVATLRSAHLGMGYFYFTPQDGKTYKAKVTYKNGMQDVIDIPASSEKTISIAVEDISPSEASVNIEAGKACYEQNKNKYYTLVLYSAGTTRTFIRKLDNPEVKIDISKGDFKSGITWITLFSPTGEPLSERLIFITNNDQVDLKISSDKPDYAKRGKVGLSLNIATGPGKTPTGHYSVAVIDEGKVPVDENLESTILTNLLLTSDLKGYVERPNYYFMNPNDATRADLDLVMLTHGYRHFEWKQVFDNANPPVTYQPEKSLSLAGTLKTLQGKPVPNGGVILVSTKEHVTRDTTTDANGNFNFTNLYLSDTSKIILRGAKENNSGRVKIDFKQPDYPAVTKINSEKPDSSGIPSLAAGLMQKQYEQRQSMKNGIILKQVNIKSAKGDPFTTHLARSSNLNGPGRADQVITGDKLVGCASLVDCLIPLVHGVRLTGNVFYSLHTPIALVGPTKPMVVILDGVITDQSVLDQISYTDVASIEVLISHAYLSVYGAAASSGAIVINTKRGDEANQSATVQPGMITYNFKGFYKAREFYSPKYDHPLSNPAPDLRTTIFWQPEVITDKDGNASVEYYNGDTPGTYRVVVEGIDDNGNIGRQVYRYKVQ